MRINQYMVLNPYSTYNSSRYYLVVKQSDLPEFAEYSYKSTEAWLSTLDRIPKYGKFLRAFNAIDKCRALNNHPTNNRKGFK